MGDYAGILTVTGLGTDLQVEDYSIEQKPNVKDGQGWVSTDITLTGRGYIQAATPAAFSAAIARLLASLSLHGQNIIITGLNDQPEVSLLAAACVDGGPHIQFKVESSDTGLYKNVSFTARAKSGATSTAGGGGPPVPADAWKLKKTTRPDGLEQVVRSGELTGPGAADYFFAATLPAAIAGYPAPKWVPAIESESNLGGGSVTYTITFTELRGTPPTGPASASVTGSVRPSVSRDEALRQVTTYEYDLLLSAGSDPVDLLTAIRPRGVVILSERYEYETLRETSLRASFQIITGADGNALMDFTQSWRIDQVDTPQIEETVYQGAASVLTQMPNRATRFTQSGRAVCAGQFFKPPPPVMFQFTAPSEVSYSHLSNVEKETTWAYHLIGPSDTALTAAFLAGLARPAQPVFL